MESGAAGAVAEAQSVARQRAAATYSRWRVEGRGEYEYEYDVVVGTTSAVLCNKGVSEGEGTEGEEGESLSERV